MVDSLRFEGLWMLLAVGFLLFAFGCLAWRAGVAAALVLVVVEGALRKWAFPQYQDFLYWTKDLVLAGVYVRYFGSRILARAPALPEAPCTSVLVPLACWGLVEAANPRLPNAAVGLFGLKAYFFYLPLVYVLRDVVDTPRALQRFLIRYSLLSIPVSLLGVVQFFSPPDSALVSYLDWDSAAREASLATVAMMGAYPRVSGTFSFISGYSTYLFVVILLLVALLNTRDRKLAGTPPLVLALVAAIVAMLMTGCRFPTFLAAGLVVAMLLMLGRLSAALRTGAVLLVVGTVVFGLFEDVVAAFWGRTLHSGDTEDRLRVLFWAPMRFLPLSLWGYGAGSTHQAARFLASGDYGWLPTDDFEEEPGRVMIELGPIGFVLFYAAKLALIAMTGRLMFTLRQADLRALAAASLVIQAGHVLMPTVFNVTASLYVWASAGLLLLLPRLDEVEPGAEARPA